MTNSCEILKYNVSFIDFKNLKLEIKYYSLKKKQGKHAI